MMKTIFNTVYLLTIFVLTICISPSFAAPPQVPPPATGQPEQQMEKPDLEIGKITSVPYTARSRRDPFLSIIVSTKKKMKERVKKQNPLENFDVTDFKIMGIIFDGKGYYASVVLPDNKAYTLRPGLKVGLFGGKVDKITNESIIIKEYVIDYMGKKQLKTTALKLRKEEVQ